jgi:hypothetical protein
MTVTRERPFAGAGELTRERITFRLTRVNRTTFRLRRHNRTRVDEIAGGRRRATCCGTASKVQRIAEILEPFA